MILKKARNLESGVDSLFEAPVPDPFRLGSTNAWEQAGSVRFLNGPAILDPAKQSSQQKYATKKEFTQHPSIPAS